MAPAEVQTGLSLHGASSQTPEPRTPPHCSHPAPRGPRWGEQGWAPRRPSVSRDRPRCLASWSPCTLGPGLATAMWTSQGAPTPTPHLLRAWIPGTQEVGLALCLHPPKTPTVGPLSGRGGTPIWGTGAYLEWPISLYPLSHRLPSEVQGPEPSQVLGAQPWPARGQRSPHSPGSQCCPPTAETDSAGLCREQNIAVGAGGIGRVLGARVATWKGLYGPVLTTSVARAQYKGVGPQLVHLALGVLRPRGLPKLSPREEGQGTSLAWVPM